jgi:hypothetical protein
MGWWSGSSGKIACLASMALSSNPMLQKKRNTNGRQIYEECSISLVIRKMQIKL